MSESPQTLSTPRKAIRESQMLSWTLESNEAGAWALFLRIGGQVKQLTPWQETREAVFEGIEKLFAGTEPPPAA